MIVIKDFDNMRIEALKKEITRLLEEISRLQTLYRELTGKEYKPFK